MTTILVLIAVLAPVAGTGVAAAVGAPVARACVVSMALAASSAIALLAVVTLDDGAVGFADLPDSVTMGSDRPSALLLVAVSGTALVVASFSRRALDAADRRASGYHIALATVTTGSALVVVPGGPVPLLVGWLVAGRALVAITRGWTDRADAHEAHVRLRTSVWVGDMALIAAVAAGVATAGPGLVMGAPGAVDDLSASTVLGIDAVTLVAVLVVVAGAARSGLVPFHRWLTATLYAPTPVSALVHAGFVSGAGLLLIRFSPTFVRADAAVALAIVLATATIVVGSVAALMRVDAKGALAWSTVAQMAFMVLQCAVGAFAAAVFHIVGHGMYKAAQFLGVGDTVAAGLRKRRQPVRSDGLPDAVRRVAVVVIATAAVAIGVTVGPEGLEQDERILLLVFAWASVAAGVDGSLRSRSLPPLAGLGTAALGATVASVAYFAAIDVVKHLLEPAFAATDVSVPGALVIVVVAVAGAPAVLACVPGSVGDAARARVRWAVAAATAVRVPLDPGSAGIVAHRSPAVVTMPGSPVGAASDAQSRADRAPLRAQVARAAEIVAPAWPLSSFVAVNPLGGLETKSFDDAASEARRWLRARTHRSLDQYRADHERGLTTSADLTFVAHDLAMVACGQPAVSAPGRVVEPIEVVLADLLHGPEMVTIDEPRTALERRLGTDAHEALCIDDLVADWLAAHLGRSPWPIEAHGDDIVRVARRQAIRHARRRLGSASVSWLESLPDDAPAVLDAALSRCGVRPSDRVDEIRGHLAALPGWTGLARWRTEWAHPGETLPGLQPIEIAAVRAMLEAAVIVSLDPPDADASASARPGEDPSVVAIPDDLLEGRVRVVVEHLGLPGDPATRAAVRDVLALVPDSMRVAIWQRAQEHRYRTRLLDRLDRGALPPRTTVPAAQVVFCIDVRSEGLRRLLEAQGSDETLGFAGFFGVPMQVRQLGWPAAEARCPVLVAPSASVVEQPLVDHIADAARTIARAGLAGAATAAHHGTKHVPGAAFAAAESLGWVVGPRAAWRTLARARPRRDHPVATSATITDDMGIEQRVFSAESVLRTMGLSNGFAELVVLCGHTSTTVNNAHATALECGACAGASGAANARAVASLLNESDVRAGLSSRGIDIPDETWFVAAVHDTASDRVTMLDRHLAPGTHLPAIDGLQVRLDRAGELRAEERLPDLPGAGDARDVQRRGSDWAQVRPEWGLATNAAFVIGPRSLTAGLDLHGRAFLHSYDADADPDGAVLEAIMTAPLVVGHWISSQYYFATVDTERFGAGDKLLHNPIGSLGVVTGAGGDLRVGLPTQSTHLAQTAHHQPLRLLAVIQADPAIVESIIARNEVLHRLVGGAWLHVAARPGPGMPWSTRSPGGSWSQLPHRAGQSFETN